MPFAMRKSIWIPRIFTPTIPLLIRENNQLQRLGRFFRPGFLAKSEKYVQMRWVL
jgi:hypothetical protein